MSRDFNFVAVRFIAILFFAVLVQVLYGQTVDDPQFKLPPSLNPGEVHISHSFRTKGISKVPLFDLEGIKRANMVLLMDKGSFEKDVGDKDGGIDVYQIEFDRDGRPRSSEQLTRREYDINRDMYAGFHSINLRHEYRGEGKVEIHYLDSDEHMRYLWKYENQHIVSCELFSGANGGLTAYWEWDYQGDTLLSDFRKFGYKNRLEYHFKYTYDEHGQLNHILKNFSNNEMHVSIYERDKNLKFITRFESLDDVFRSCYTIDNGLLIKNYGCKPPRRSRAEKEIWRYNSAGLPVKVQIFSGSAHKPTVWEYAYNDAGSILRKTYENNVLGPFITQYTYSADNRLKAIKYFKNASKNWSESAVFEYDEKGNVIRWTLNDQAEFEMEYHYFD